MLRAVGESLSLLSRREKATYFTLLSIRALSGILDVAGIALIGLLAGLAASNFESNKPLVMFGFTLPHADESTMVKLVLLVLAVFAIKAVIAVWLGRAISKFLAKIESEKAVEIAVYLFSGDLSHINRLTKGEVLWALMGSSSFAFSGLLTSLTIFVTEGILFLLVAATFMVVDPLATLFVFIYFSIIIVAIQFVIGHSLKNAGIDAAQGNMNGTVVVDDVLGAFREISVFKKEDYFIEKFRIARRRVSESSGTLVFLGGMPRYVVETALMLGVVIFVGWQFVTGQLATGLVTVGVFLTGGVRIMASLLPLQNAASNVKNQAEQSRMAMELITLSRKEAKPSQKISTQDSEQIIHDRYSALDVHIENASFKYPNSENQALSNINMHIEAGQHIAIIGPSGAGKTTLVDMILGLLEPQIGSIRVGGIRPNELLSQIPGLISYVPQNPGIISGSLAENIAIGVAEEEIDYQQLNKALEAANLRDFVNSLPDGVHTSVGNQSDALSGGQIQRLGLARALYEKPKLIVLDEATSALDAGSEAYISSSLRSLGADVTVIVIAHRLSTVQHSDCVYVIEDGEITAEGTFQHLRKTVPMVAEYVELMSFDQLD